MLINEHENRNEIANHAQKGDSGVRVIAVPELSIRDKVAISGR